ncbi:hypothetical protein L6Q21_07185 [Sandaracinobacter sp. RS1-74]|uniref:hypothetical protein n=1 Tax=Sandaracinobacteroides sayramensis TaxID=2913411 RepID=UPI001EDA4617|nr:hypothetical protein [Sandaracinobacteroides sayramensis]MCG2840760.1 hypothetical protein [Sandaracinobacteroides sayramensis]
MNMETTGRAAERRAAQMRQARLAGRVRRRAIADGALLLLLVAAAAFFARDSGSGSGQAVLNALVVVSAGIGLFLYRRGRDLSALARADRWRAEAVEGRGLSLSAWNAGGELSGWEERRDRP